LLRQVIRSGLEPFLESTRTLVALLDRNGGLVAANPSFRAVWDDRPGASAIRELITPSLQDYAEHLFQTAHRERSIARGSIEFGSEREAVRCECLIVALENGASLLFAEPVGEEVHLQAVKERLEAELLAARSALADKVVELQAVKAQADEVIHTDALTFLPNRRLVLTKLQEEVMRAKRYATALTISMLDLDDFKKVNDELGHAAGDKVLVTIGKELRDQMRQSDEIGRYGGDEFLVILPNSSSVAASEQAARLCQLVRHAGITIDETPVPLTLSVGIAQFKPHADDWQTLLERADRALYEAKHAGGDQWVILES
jgi:diguanylate cyclase (GGDEF)-like protein